MRQSNETKFFKVVQKLWKFYHLMYTDESNPTFDQCHDNLYYQLKPLGDMVGTTDRKISDADLNEITRLLKEVQNYYKTTQNLKEPTWIYA